MGKRKKKPTRTSTSNPSTNSPNTSNTNTSANTSTSTSTVVKDDKRSKQDGKGSVDIVFPGQPQSVPPARSPQQPKGKRKGKGKGKGKGKAQDTSTLNHSITTPLTSPSTGKGKGRRKGNAQITGPTRAHIPIEVVTSPSPRRRRSTRKSSASGDEVGDELLGELPSGALSQFGDELSRSLMAAVGSKDRPSSTKHTPAVMKEIEEMRERLAQLERTMDDQERLKILGWLSGTAIKAAHREMLSNNRSLLAPLVPPLYSDNVSVQWHAARFISSISYNDTAISMLLGDAGAVDAIFSVLRGGDDSAIEVRQEVLWALLYLTGNNNFVNMEAISECCDGEGFNTLVTVLASPDDLLVQLSCRIIANLASVPEFRLTLCRLGVTRDLLPLLAAVDEGVAKYATVALGALSYDETCRRDICELGGIPVMLHTGKEDIHLQQLCCLILSNVSFTPDLRHYLVQENEVIKHCVSLAQSPDLLVQREVAKLFVNLTATRDLQQSLSAFPILHIFGTLLRSPNTNIKILALGGLANLCTDPLNCDEVVLPKSEGSLRTILDLAMSPDTSVQELAVQLIGDLVTGDDTRQTIVAESGGAALLIYLLSSPGMNIRLRATKALANLAEGTHATRNRLVHGGILAPLVAQLSVASVELWQLTAYTISALVATKPIGRAFRHANGLKPLITIMNAGPRTHPTALEYVLKAVHAVVVADSNNMRELYNIAGWSPFSVLLNMTEKDRVLVRTLAILLEMSKFRDVRSVMCVPELYSPLISLARSRFDVVRALTFKLLIAFGNDLPDEVREYLGVPDMNDAVLNPGGNANADVSTSMRSSRARQQGDLLATPASGHRDGATETSSADEFQRDYSRVTRRTRPRSEFYRMHKLSAAGFFARGVLSDSSDAPYIPRSENISFPGGDDSRAGSGLSATERVTASVRAVAKPVRRAVGKVFRNLQGAASYLESLQALPNIDIDHSESVADGNDADKSDFAGGDSGADSPWSN